MNIVGNMTRPDLPVATKPAEPTAEAVANAPAVPNPTLDGTAEGGPPRGGMEEIWKARRAGPAEGPPGQVNFGARKGLNEVKLAVRESVSEALQSGELSEEEAEALKEAANALRHELQTAKQGIEPGEIDTGVAAYDAVSTAVQDFFGTLEGILGGENIADTDVSATAEDEGAEVVALGDPAEDATSTYESIVDSVGEALDGFWAALQEGGPARRANPFAGYYEAVGTVTDPNLEASTSTTVSLV